ncbi:pyridoxal 5'-phosphate synthase glutaminase subunit PdxT [Halocatena halophila]|uniref:pyridoxal 5'-phosphate synthase glutaminase subunit PdxT n=1 Tax=Halocatena halophila TaxID=2814576 RepID=UPI002ED1D6AD
MTLTAGVIAVQGDVSEHVAALERSATACGVDLTVQRVRTAGTVPSCDMLVLPGGESTTISDLLVTEKIASEIVGHVEAGNPLLATCAGLIVVSRDPRDERVHTLDCLDISVDRNAFGRQRDSFEAPLPIRGLERPFPAVFIRAPLIDSVGPSVEVLAAWEDRPVAVRSGSVVATSFHPELTHDSRLHELALFEQFS